MQISSFGIFRCTVHNVKSPLKIYESVVCIEETRITDKTINNYDEDTFSGLKTNTADNA